MLPLHHSAVLLPADTATDKDSALIAFNPSYLSAYKAVACDVHSCSPRPRTWKLRIQSPVGLPIPLASSKLQTSTGHHRVLTRPLATPR